MIDLRSVSRHDRRDLGVNFLLMDRFMDRFTIEFTKEHERLCKTLPERGEGLLY